MFITIDSEIIAEKASPWMMAWCKECLEIDNPEYIKRKRLGKWTGGVAKKLKLYTVKNGVDYHIPYGCLQTLLMNHQCKRMVNSVPKHERVEYPADMHLYDYQQKALCVMAVSNNGILEAPAGSGKTQIGLALAREIGYKTLWIVHTKDLLEQAKARAEQYFDKSLMGTITEGKVEIGQWMTFATIQSLVNIDLNKYKDEWGCIIVDECHRVSGSPTTITMYYKVLNRLRCLHKFGLSATMHRADGMIMSTICLIGNIAYSIKEEDVADNIMKVHVNPVYTNTPLDNDCLNSDGTLNYQSMISSLCENDERNELILHNLIENSENYNLILSHRVEHLKHLYSLLPEHLQAVAKVIDGKMVSKKAKEERSQAIEDMRTGKNHYLFATYSLAKEGLDIPRLDRLYMVTPQKDYAIIVQSIGRIARTFEHKTTPIAYDYVDYSRVAQKAFRERCRHYRKSGCTIEGE